MPLAGCWPFLLRSQKIKLKGNHVSAPNSTNATTSIIHTQTKTDQKSNQGLGITSCLTKGVIAVIRNVYCFGCCVCGLERRAERTTTLTSGNRVTVRVQRVRLLASHRRDATLCGKRRKRGKKGCRAGYLSGRRVGKSAQVSGWTGRLGLCCCGDCRLAGGVEGISGIHNWNPHRGFAGSGHGVPGVVETSKTREGFCG